MFEREDFTVEDGVVGQFGCRGGDEVRELAGDVLLTAGPEGGAVGTDGLAGYELAADAVELPFGVVELARAESVLEVGGIATELVGEVERQRAECGGGHLGG